MANLTDLIIEKRTNYLKNIKRKIQDILVEQPLENLKKLMFIENKAVRESKKIVSFFIENAKEKEYFKNFYNKIKGKPFSYETLKEIKEIAGINEIDYDSILNNFFQISSVIDRFYAPFLEPLRSFPKIYSSGEYPEGFGLEPNCIGATQTIAVLYSYERDINDLIFLEIYSSKRRDNLLKKLKELNESKEEYSISNFDTFFYGFKTDELKNMVLDQILSIEEFTHGAIKNNKTNEVYDYEIERENYKGILEYEIEDGLFYSTFSNLLFLMNYLNYNKEILKEAFSEYYNKFKDSVLFNSVGLALYSEDGDEKARNFLNKIKEIYKTEEDLPARYITIEILLDYPKLIWNDNKIKKEIKNKLNYLKEKYILPEALKYISERYCNSSLLVDLDDSLDNVLIEI